MNQSAKRQALSAYKHLLSIVSEQLPPRQEPTCALRQMEETLLCVMEWLQWRLYGGHASYGVFGTTSAGKSTLLNLLVGHRILPTDADELSAGLIFLRQSSDLSAHLHYTTSTGPVHTELDVDDVSTWFAAHLRALKHSRSLVESTSPSQAKTFTLRVPLPGVQFWFGASPSEITLVDLPGLRVADDGLNRPFIELAARHLHPLIVTDIQRLYLPELVEEVCDVIARNSNARDDVQPVIVVNKTDAHDASARTVDEAIEHFRDLVHSRLGSAREPLVVGVSALGLSCAMELRLILTDFLVDSTAARTRVKNHGAEILQTADRIIRARHLAAPGEDLRGARRALREFEDALESSSIQDISVGIFATLSRFVFARAGGERLRATLHAAYDSTPRVRRGMVKEDLPNILSDRTYGDTARDGAPPLASIAAAFKVIIEADGVVDAREVEMASMLFREYLQIFWGSSWDDDSHGPIEAFILSAGRHFEPFAMKQGEHEWLMGALEMLAASDWTIDPEELDAINRVDAVIDGM